MSYTFCLVGRGVPWETETEQPMTELADQACVPCAGGQPPLEARQARELLQQLEPGWEIVQQHHLRREFRFANFRAALDFTNRVGELAEALNHHPDMELAWGRVVVTIWTHKINGLHQADFVWAAKVDRLYRECP